MSFIQQITKSIAGKKEVTLLIDNTSKLGITQIIDWSADQSYPAQIRVIFDRAIHLMQTVFDDSFNRVMRVCKK